MADDEFSRSNASESLDDDEYDDDDNGEDYEATLDEEEALDQEDYSNELQELEDEGEMSIEELRRKYGYPGGDAAADDVASASSSATEVAEPMESQAYFDSNADDAAQDEQEESEDVDKDYTPPDPWRKDIRVDEVQYQANVPTDLIPPSPAHYASETLWVPCENLADEQITAYLQKFAEVHRLARLNADADDECGLATLQFHKYNLDVALSSTNVCVINRPLRTVPENATIWTVDEITAFERGLTMYGKNFFLIQQLMPQRRVGELVQFYYQWKLTDRFREYKRMHPHFTEMPTSAPIGHLPIGHVTENIAAGNSVYAAPPVNDIDKSSEAATTGEANASDGVVDATNTVDASKVAGTWWDVDNVAQV